MERSLRIARWREGSSSNGARSCRPVAWLQWRRVLGRTFGAENSLQWAWTRASFRHNLSGHTACKVAAAKTMRTTPRPSARQHPAPRCTSCQPRLLLSKACSACADCAKASRKNEQPASIESEDCWASLVSSSLCSAWGLVRCRTRKPCSEAHARTRIEKSQVRDRTGLRVLGTHDGVGDGPPAFAVLVRHYREHVAVPPLFADM